MTDIDIADAIKRINIYYIRRYPAEVAHALEATSTQEAVELLLTFPEHIIVLVWELLSADTQDSFLSLLPTDTIRILLTKLEPAQGANVINRQTAENQQKYLALVTENIANELREMLEYPPDTAGRLMDPRIFPLRGEMTVAEAQLRLRKRKPKALRELYLIDRQGKLTGRVEIQDLIIADSEQILSKLAKKIFANVQDIASREEVLEKLEKRKLASMPVVDFEERFVGVILAPTLVSAMQEEASVDIQTMVGVSKDEKALSNIRFSVLKRLPWLHINLLTAFLAAAVVGLFESTIAKFTALAVLLPVVAGQSGNAGAQALAVTMRGLSLREISMRHWLRVAYKEVSVGFFNGVAIAITTSIGVFIWSRSTGLALVIAIAMVLSMVAAGFSGALIPITLRRLGQDPAQSSSIILTTVTDIVGFFSFLGIATLLSTLL